MHGERAPALRATCEEGQPHRARARPGPQVRLPGRRPRGVSHAKLAAAVLSIATLFGAVHTAPSLAAGAPHWSIAAESVPTYFSAGDESDAYVLIVRNDGGAPTKVGETVHITDVLPSGVTPLGAEARGEAPDNNGEPRYKATCSVDGETDTASCKYGEGEGMAPVLPGAVIEMVVTVSIAPGLTK